MNVFIFCSRVETIDGSAVGGEDFVALNQVIVFEANEIEKQVSRFILTNNYCFRSFN